MTNRIVSRAILCGMVMSAARSHVGIDMRLSRRLAFRYSFSETINRNPISPSLSPPSPGGPTP